ncbi:hypothetical protein [Streptomyces sp. cg40]|uniref:hypothetical protein n=1 Tax=Streptomyces sp. cg40 TaxID=3419764 RepID=UPI003D004234
MLAELGGEPVLSRADVFHMERLIRIKLLEDRPQPLLACWNHWMAVPSGDQAGIMRALDLTDPRPVTFALGNDIVDSDGHGCDTDEYTSHERVFITPNSTAGPLSSVPGATRAARNGAQTPCADASS